MKLLSVIPVWRYLTGIGQFGLIQLLLFCSVSAAEERRDYVSNENTLHLIRPIILRWQSNLGTSILTAIWMQ
jgi:hypothetical protein